MVISALTLQLSSFFFKHTDTINIIYFSQYHLWKDGSNLIAVFMKLRFHFLEGFRVHEVLLYVDSSGFSGFNSLQKIMCEGKAVSIKY